MLARVILLMLLWLAAGMLAFADSESITLHYEVIGGFPVKYVAVNMRDPDIVVTTALAGKFPYGGDSWNTFITRLQPDAAINGTYFCTHSYIPVGDIAVDGELCCRGVLGTALCITPDNEVCMLPGPHDMRPDWHGYRTVLCAGPRLLTDGAMTINARAEGFSDPHVLGSASRSAVAWRPDGLLLLLTIKVPISLPNLAAVCRHLGATEAMGLDGGSSSALYYAGRTVTRPGRSLSNILAVYRTHYQFQSFAKRLMPASLNTLARLLPPPETSGNDQSGVVVSVRPATPRATAPTLSLIRNPTPLSTPTSTPSAPLINFICPDTSQPLHGIVPVHVEVAKDSHLNWMSLRINGKLRAMSNIWPFDYKWDSTQEQDGCHTLEITAWSIEHTVLAHEVRQVHVNNAPQVASDQ